MSKATFSVVVINSGRERDYYDFWLHGIKRNDAGEELHPDLLGFTELIEAKNIAEAASLVRAKHPRLQIDAKATQRHG